MSDSQEVVVDVDAADIDIESWNAERGNPMPEEVEAHIDPADVRDEDEEADA